MAKYRISALDWCIDLEAKFGEQYSIVGLSDKEVIELIYKFGRASISDIPNPLGKPEYFDALDLCFENGYN